MARKHIIHSLFAFNTLTHSKGQDSSLMSSNPTSNIDKRAAVTSDVTDWAALGDDFASGYVVGPNDASLYDILEACVFHFQAGAAVNCTPVLNDFQDKLDRVLPTALTSTINQIAEDVPNIAKFVVVEYTTSSMKGVNDAVTNLNKVTSAAVSKTKGHARPEMTFVDYSADWDGHRFREESVQEPDFYNRQNTWFFYVPDESFFWGAFNDLKPGTNPAADMSTCRDTSKANGNWDEKALCEGAWAEDPSNSILRDHTKRRDV
ncbi:hypothetical protein OEA41_008383 [Lepraria neglecta]|uniref:Uncharacterized protein n=1 Tax=Lepraria neglecta TaxID=209136 RepID=A0AAE0DP31_9LECA|nr:hypothetical protein OEA41_008383 [Lepraria neglecta]